jgi:GNAT superfamily N-acetyltransferase
LTRARIGRETARTDPTFGPGRPAFDAGGPAGPIGGAKRPIPIHSKGSRANYVAKLDWRRTIVIGCFDGVQLRGAAELHFDPPGAASREGEFAVTVEPRWRGAGLGTEFLRRTILVARNRMIARLRMVCLLDNGPMRRIARRFGAMLSVEEGQAWADIRLPYPDPLSLASEAWGDGLGYAAAIQARHAPA